MHSIKKRLANQITILRYIQEYQIYQISIVWQSEKPIPPTIHYLPEIFLNPFMQMTPISPYNPSKIFKNQQTSQQITQNFAKIPQKIFEKKLKRNDYPHQIERSKKNNKRQNQTLDYDALMTRNKIIAMAIQRNKSVIKYSTPKDVLHKKKKIV